LTDERWPTETGDVAQEEFFDTSFLAELEDLAKSAGRSAAAAHPLSSELHRKLEDFLRGGEGRPAIASEDAFATLSRPALAERTNELLSLCRESPHTVAVQGVENFIVFFQALVPTLGPEQAEQVTRLFHRLVPTLLHMAHDPGSASAEESHTALRNLESILIEIASVRLTPTESELIFRSIDQMVAFVNAAEFTMANEVISSQLLGIISRNRLTRALFRLMEVEVSVQKYLKERLGYLTPRIRLPEDVEALSEYGPIRIFDEESFDGPRRLLQVHLPDIPILRDIVLHLAGEAPAGSYDLRFDALGTAELSVPDGTYDLGFVYQPGE
jgi:hypothetical protein